MCSISTFIDLSQGMLFMEAPHCKERLEIMLDSDVYVGAREDIDLYGQRYMIIYTYLLSSNIIYYLLWVISYTG